MIPGALVELPRVPLNANGKVDRKALPPPELSREPDRALEPPRNELEQAMVDAWRSVLGGRKLGVNDNYFHLGGDSITAIQLISRLKQAGWELPCDLFSTPPSGRSRRYCGARQCVEPSQHVVHGGSVTPSSAGFRHTGDLHHFIRRC
jgi:iturin family lipopeptide synthetase C